MRFVSSRSGYRASMATISQGQGDPTAYDGVAEFGIECGEPGCSAVTTARVRGTGPGSLSAKTPALSAVVVVRAGALDGDLDHVHEAVAGAGCGSCILGTGSAQARMASTSSLPSHAADSSASGASGAGCVGRFGCSAYFASTGAGGEFAVPPRRSSVVPTERCRG